MVGFWCLTAKSWSDIEGSILLPLADETDESDDDCVSLCMYGVMILWIDLVSRRKSALERGGCDDGVSCSTWRQNST